PSAVILSILTTTDPLPTALLFSTISATYGGSTTLQATLLGNGCGISGETINFRVAGDVVGSATTGSNGTASLLLTLGLRPTGNHTLAASYGGSSHYSRSSASASLTITAATPTLS